MLAEQENEKEKNKRMRKKRVYCQPIISGHCI